MSKSRGSPRSSRFCPPEQKLIAARLAYHELVSHCPKCGFERKDGIAWCRNCGQGAPRPSVARILAAVGIVAAVAAFAVVMQKANWSKGMLSASAKIHTQPPPSLLTQRSSTSKPATTLDAPGREGPFQVFASTNRKPSVRIQNNSDIILRFSLHGSDGRDFAMNIPPHADATMDVEVGHYDAEVFDPTGMVQSAAGDATFAEFREYRDSFWVGDYQDNNGFHIGD